MLQVLRDRSFRNIWLASMLSMLGSQISRIGLLLYVFDQKGAVANLAALIVLETLPGAMAAPLAGALVDSLNKRSVMIAADLSRMGFLLVIIVRPSLGTIYSMAALSSIASIFFEPARSAAIPLIVKQEDLPLANAAEQSMANLPMIAGPVIGALLLRQFGLTFSLLLDAFSFLVSATLVARARIRRVERPRLELSAAAVVGEILEGWRYLKGHRLALHLNLLLFVALICTGIWTPLAPFFIRTRLGASEHLLGWQLGLFGVGAALGAMIAPKLLARFGSGITLFAGFLAEATCLSVYGMVSRVVDSMVVVLILGVALSVVVVPFYSILQTIVDEKFLGRVFSLVKQSESVAVVLAMIAAVTLQSLMGSHLIFLFAGLIYLSFTALSSLSPGGRALLATR